MKNNQTYLFQIGLHVLIGLLIYWREGFGKVYFFGAFFYFVYHIVTAPEKEKTFTVLKACGYFVGAEVLLRMTKGAISYEAGKYVVIFFMLFGTLYKGLSGKGYPYFMYLVFLVPSIFVASTTLSFDANFRTNIAFVLSGPVCLGIAALFCYDKRISFNQMSEILLFTVLPIIAHAIYIFFYVPDLQDVLTGTASNRSTSGGWGPNQVSAILGLGITIISFRLFTKSPTFFLKILNASLLMMLSYRAIVTFSRGGVFTAAATVAVFLLFYFMGVGDRKKNEILSLFALFLISLAVTWYVSTRNTQGLIELRYENKDHLGRDKGDITTGRGDLLMGELEGFISSPFLGIGSSRAKDQRIEIEGHGVTSHSEVSRVLAEHGMFGVAILVILIFKPLAIRSRNQENYYFYAFMAFWFLTINHMSMRIAMPAFIYALALLNVTHEKNPLRRKRLKAQVY